MATTSNLLLVTMLLFATACAPVRGVEKAPSDSSPQLFRALVADESDPTTNSAKQKDEEKVGDELEKSDTKPAVKPEPKSEPKPVAKPSTPTNKQLDLDEDDIEDMDARWDGHNKRAEAWTLATARAVDQLGDALLTKIPGDIEYYCPKFSKLDREDRIAFWVHLISAMAEKESDFDEDQKYKEKFNDSSNTNVVSRGLLQLSKEAANLYGCQIEVGSELETGARNLRCGVRILNRWIERDGVIKGGEKGAWRGAARYWAIFRTDKTRHFIQKATLALDLCSK